jgi:hypothetical protein
MRTFPARAAKAMKSHELDGRTPRSHHKAPPAKEKKIAEAWCLVWLHHDVDAFLSGGVTGGSVCDPGLGCSDGLLSS